MATTEVEELLALEGNSSATIEEYVSAAKLLTGLRAYRVKVADVVEGLAHPDLTNTWEFWDGHPLFDRLRDVDDTAAQLMALLERVDKALAEPLWRSVEQTVRQAAVRKARAGGIAPVVPDANGKWIEKGHGHLVQGTRPELAAASERWTLLDEVLPPKFPNEASRQMGPGVS